MTKTHKALLIANIVSFFLNIAVGTYWVALANLVAVIALWMMESR
jgi:hypothetical protein